MQQLVCFITYNLYLGWQFLNWRQEWEFLHQHQSWQFVSSMKVSTQKKFQSFTATNSDLIISQSTLLATNQCHNIRQSSELTTLLPSCYVRLKHLLCIPLTCILSYPVTFYCYYLRFTYLTVYSVVCNCTKLIVWYQQKHDRIPKELWYWSRHFITSYYWCVFPRAHKLFLRCL